MCNIYHVVVWIQNVDSSPCVCWRLCPQGIEFGGGPLKGNWIMKALTVSVDWSLMDSSLMGLLRSDGKLGARPALMGVSYSMGKCPLGLFLLSRAVFAGFLYLLPGCRGVSSFPCHALPLWGFCLTTAWKPQSRLTMIWSLGSCESGYIFSSLNCFSKWWKTVTKN